MKHFARAAALIAALTTGIGSAAAAPSADASLVDFANPDPVLTIKDALTPITVHQPRNPTDPTGISSGRPTARTSGQSRSSSDTSAECELPDSAASDTSGDRGRRQLGFAVNIENLNAYGRRAYRVIIPPATSVAIVVQMATAAEPPSLMAWTEPALAAHNRQLAIFTTAVWR